MRPRQAPPRIRGQPIPNLIFGVATLRHQVQDPRGCDYTSFLNIDSLKGYISPTMPELQTQIQVDLETAAGGRVLVNILAPPHDRDCDIHCTRIFISAI
jgi:hypothetical protein